MKIRNKLYPMIAVLLSLAPVIFVVSVLFNYAINVPILDEWDYSVFHVLNDDLMSGRIGQFWTLHNLHRIFVPHVVHTALGHLTSLNYIPFLVIPVVLSYMIALLSFFLLRTTHNSMLSFTALPMFSVLMLAPTYSADWLTGRASHNYYVLLAFPLIYLVLLSTTPGWLPFLLILLLTTIASLSFGAGYALWGIALIWLYFNGYRKRNYFIVWTGVASLLIGLHINDLIQLGRLSINDKLTSILDIVGYLLKFQGNVFVYRQVPLDNSISFITGVVGVGALVVMTAYLTKAYGQNGFLLALPWVGIGAGMLATAFLTLLSGGALEYVPQRYTQWSGFFWVGVLGLTLSTIAILHHQNAPFTEYIAPALSSVVIIFGTVYMFLSYSPYETFGRHSNRYAAGLDCLHYYEIAPDACLQHIYPGIRPFMPDVFAIEPQFLNKDSIQQGHMVRAATPSDIEAGWNLTIPDETVIVLKTHLATDAIISVQYPDDEYQHGLQTQVFPSLRNRDVYLDLAQFAGDEVQINFSHNVGYAEIWILDEPLY